MPILGIKNRALILTTYLTLTIVLACITPAITIPLPKKPTEARRSTRIVRGVWALGRAGAEATITRRWGASTRAQAFAVAAPTRFPHTHANPSPRMLAALHLMPIRCIPEPLSPHLKAPQARTLRLTCKDKAWPMGRGGTVSTAAVPSRIGVSSSYLCSLAPNRTWPQTRSVAARAVLVATETGLDTALVSIHQVSCSPRQLALPLGHPFAPAKPTHRNLYPERLLDHQRRPLDESGASYSSEARAEAASLSSVRPAVRNRLKSPGKSRNFLPGPQNTRDCSVLADPFQQRSCNRRMGSDGVSPQLAILCFPPREGIVLYDWPSK
ncbi:hypothetical protein FB451DRAFT_1359003 [Mycena latifolia]|nr:hypothetical protein FB451DRAFT_1359003 [Mycena latifolia]